MSADPEAPTGDEILSEDEAFDALEPQPQPQLQPSSSRPGLLRPGVVHRLDKGTTGAELRCSMQMGCQHL
jgi:23S rRNA-/tRNA-specific pseudouridylate synthase